MRYYKGIAYDINPYKKGIGLYQDLLQVENEPKYIVYTPDIEFYCDTIKACKSGINSWIRKNGDIKTYRNNLDNGIPF